MLWTYWCGWFWALHGAPPRLLGPPPEAWQGITVTHDLELEEEMAFQQLRGPLSLNPKV